MRFHSRNDDTLQLLLAFSAGAAVTFLAGTLLMRPRRLFADTHTPVADARLRDAVRERVDKLVSHPRAIEVEVHEGVVRVSGQVLATELDGLLMRLTAVPGVHRVRNALSTLTDPAGFGEVHVSAI